MPRHKTVPCSAGGNPMPSPQPFRERSEQGTRTRRPTRPSQPENRYIEGRNRPVRAGPRRTDTEKAGVPPVAPVPNFSDPASGGGKTGDREAAVELPSPPDRAPVRYRPDTVGPSARRQEKHSGKNRARDGPLPDTNALIPGTRRHRHSFRAVLFRLEEDEYGKKNVNLTAHRHPIRCNEP